MPKYKKQKDGRYYGRVWTGDYKDGEKVYTVLTSQKSSLDLEKKIKEYEAKRDSIGILYRNTDSMLDYAYSWLENSKAMSSENTRLMYRHIIDYHLQDLKYYTFDKFSYGMIQDLINQAKDKPRTCQQIKLTLKQICKAAELDKLIEKGSVDVVFKRVQLPDYESKEKRPLTNREKQMVLDGEFTEKQKVYISILYYTGMRKQEVLALQKKDIVDNTIKVSKALLMTGDKTEIKDTKTKRGKRSIPIVPRLKEILDAYTKDMNPEDIIVPNQNGEYMTKSGYRRFWEAIQNIFGTDITAHLFRHNYCTMLCYQSATKRNITIKKIAELLGDTEKMVLDVYSHIVEEKEMVEESIENALK